MERKNTLLQLGFLIVVLLAIGLAFLRVSNTGIGASVPEKPVKRQARPERFFESEIAQRSLDALKQEELLGVTPDMAAAYAKGGSSYPATYPQENARVGGGYVSSGNGGAVRRGNGRSGSAASYGNTGGYEGISSQTGAAYNRYAGREGSAASAGSYASAYRGSRERAPQYGYSSAGKNGSAGTGAGSASGGLGGVARPTTEQRMQGVFSPYLTSLTKEQSESLKNQLTGLSSRVERAVLQALMPKSRKDANIEKYLQRNSSYSANAGPFGSVMEQMASQKAGIMNSMNGAFGKDAADEAGKVMDAYQRELAAALAQPGQTQQQLAQKTRAIGQKYEKELQDVGQKHALKEFKDKQTEKDDILTARLAGAYGQDIASQAAQTLAAAREKDMQLAMAGLPEDEYYKQYLENQRTRRKELEQMLLKNGKSLQGLQSAEDELERRRVEQALKDEAEGKTLAKEHHFDDKTIATAANDLKRERDEKLELAERIYGETGGAAVNAIYDRHEARMSEIMQSDWPLTVKQQKMMEVRQETNEEIAALQKTPKMREAREQGQVNSTMAQLMQDPGVANASPEEKAAFESYARPVLQDMFHRINAISESDLPEDVKQKQIAAVQDRAQRQLSGGK